jgi:hypothetical protein
VPEAEEIQGVIERGARLVTIHWVYDSIVDFRQQPYERYMPGHDSADN